MYPETVLLDGLLHENVVRLTKGSKESVGYNIRKSTLINYNEALEKFLKSHEHCNIATISKDGFPHCVPIAYVYHEDVVYVPTSTRSKKVQNLRLNQKCCIVVDIYDERKKGKGVMLQGLATFVTLSKDRNQEYSRLFVRNTLRHQKHCFLTSGRFHR